MKSKKKTLFPYLLVIPGIIVLGLIIFFPFIRNVLYSFTDYQLTNPDYEFVGIENYIRAVTKGNLFAALKNSFVWVSPNIVLMMALGMLAAFLQNSKHIKGVLVFQVFLLLPWVIPEAVTGYIWKLLLNYETGIYYQLLQFFHIIPEKYDIFANDFPAMLSCVMANVWRSFPIIAMTVLAKLRSIQIDQLEAAVLDGAGRKDIFFFLELPHIKPVLLSVGTLCFVWTFNSFGIIDIMTGGGPAKATETLPVFLQREAFQYYDYSGASTYAVIGLVILVTIVLGATFLPRILGKWNEE